MIRLYHADCLSIMPMLKSQNLTDLCAITSPPYNLGKYYGTVVDDQRDDYLEWLVSVLSQMQEICSCIWLNLGYRKLETGNIPIAYQIWDRVGMYLIQEITWEYDAGMTYKKRFNHRSEKWLWFARDPRYYTFHPDAVRDPSLRRGAFDKRNNPNGKLPGDVWFFNRVPGTSSKRHGPPAQFPGKMIERIVRACTNPGDTIIDPFMGTGTAGMVAAKEGRNFIGIEKDARHFCTAKNQLLLPQSSSASYEIGNEIIKTEGIMPTKPEETH